MGTEALLYAARRLLLLIHRATNTLREIVLPKRARTRSTLVLITGRGSYRSRAANRRYAIGNPRIGFSPHRRPRRASVHFKEMAAAGSAIRPRALNRLPISSAMLTHPPDLHRHCSLSRVPDCSWPSPTAPGQQPRRVVAATLSRAPAFVKASTTASLETSIPLISATLPPYARARPGHKIPSRQLPATPRATP